MINRKDCLETIYKLIEHCDTWQEVKSSIEERGFLELLNTSDFEALAQKWQTKLASCFSDYELKQEIEHWANGGDFNNHLKGFNAVQPKKLIEEAKSRGWVIKNLASGFAISLPKGGVLFLNNKKLEL